DDCSGFLIFLVERVHVVNPDRHPCSGLSLSAFAQEYLDFAPLNTTEGRRIAPIPLLFEAQFIDVVLDRGREVFHVQNRRHIIERVHVEECNGFDIICSTSTGRQTNVTSEPSRARQLCMRPGHGCCDVCGCARPCAYSKNSNHRQAVAHFWRLLMAWCRAVREDRGESIWRTRSKGSDKCDHCRSAACTE